MITRGFDALHYLDRAQVGRMIDRCDLGERMHAAWQIVDQGRWVADVTQNVGELLIREGLVEDVADADFNEPIYRVSRRGWIVYYAMLPQVEDGAMPKPLPPAPAAVEFTPPDGPTRMMRRLCPQEVA